MIHQAFGNRVTIAKYKKVLCLPREFSKPSVLSQDETTAEEMNCFVAHITLNAFCSWVGLILPLEVSFPSQCILKTLRSRVGSHLCGHGHLKVLPHHGAGIQNFRDLCFHWWSWHSRF